MPSLTGSETIELPGLRVKLAAAEQERDKSEHASAINARLVHEAQQDAERLRDTLKDIEENASPHGDCCDGESHAGLLKLIAGLARSALTGSKA